MAGETKPTIVVHGGAGPIPRRGITRESERRAALERAMRAAEAALADGATAAAQAAVEVLEDDPHFNAGRGSVLTADGTVEMDAAVACGRTRAVGAVAAIRGVRHPVAAARAVLERTPHVLLAGDGAERFVEEVGLEQATEEWLAGGGDSPGTVGAVVLTADGSLAAATSTGGMRGQRPGRIGDSAVVGAGTYADDTCAVSLTGDGEPVMRAVAAHELSALIRLRGLDLASAADSVLADVEALGGRAGLIAVGADGTIALPFTTGLMYRGWMRAGEAPQTAVLPPGTTS